MLVSWCKVVSLLALYCAGVQMEFRSSQTSPAVLLTKCFRRCNTYRWKVFLIIGKNSRMQQWCKCACWLKYKILCMHYNERRREARSVFTSEVGIVTNQETISIVTNHEPISTGETRLGPISVFGLNYLVYKCQCGSIATISSAKMKTHHYCQKMSMWPWILASPC